MNTLFSAESCRNLCHFFPPQLVVQWYDEVAPSIEYRDRDLPRPTIFLAMLKYACDGFGNLTHAFSAAAAELQPGVSPEGISKGSVTPARKRLPVKVIERSRRHIISLVHECSFASPLKGFRVRCLDGTTFTTADTPENAKAYGYPGSRTGECAFPALRSVLMMEAATHLFTAERHGAYDRASEQALADALLEESVQPGDLIEADRGLSSCARLRRIKELGGDALMRVKKSLELPVHEVLPDGSFISAMRDSALSINRDIPRGKHPDDIRVRVIEYQVLDDAGNIHQFRLVTTVLDHQRLEAKAAAVGYHLRWGIEVGIREVKWLRERFRVPHFPGKSPESVAQEYQALLLAHSVLRCAIAFAAKEHRVDPTRLSLSGTLAVLERHLPCLAKAPSGEEEVWIRKMFRDISRQKLPVPNGRVCPRVVKRWVRKFPAKKRNQPASTYPNHRLELPATTGTAA